MTENNSTKFGWNGFCETLKTERRKNDRQKKSTAASLTSYFVAALVVGIVGLGGFGSVGCSGENRANGLNGAGRALTKENTDERTSAEMNGSASEKMRERALDKNRVKDGNIVENFENSAKKQPFSGDSAGYEDEKTYTYSLSISGMKTLNWNPHTWQEAGNKKIMDYINVGFFDFVLTDDRADYLAVPEMAVYTPDAGALFKDVTASYAGRFGVKKGEISKAFRVYLNPDATFDKTGGKIRAEDYVYSMQALLDPEMQNRRADSYYGGDFAVYNAKKYLYGEVKSFSEVGLLSGAESGLEYLDVVLESPLSQPEFYLPYYLSSNWLVERQTYEKNKIYYYDDGTKTVGERKENKKVASVGSQYCTDLQTTVGYGPYSLTGYAPDGYLRLTRNDGWYGYRDGRHEGQFQADAIEYVAVEDHKTELLAFLKGEIDEVTLDSADMQTYGASSYIEYTPQDYTTKLTLNTDYDKLKARGDQDGVNKTMLIVPAFRRAISLSINRDEFCAAYTAAGSAGYGLLNTMYVFNPVLGGAYRGTEEGKSALCRLYGLEYGAGKKYATVEEAYEAVTGYDLPRARAEMQAAYEYATTHDKDGSLLSDVDKRTKALYDGKTPIKIDLVVYSADETYVQTFNYLAASVRRACEGTALEGKVSLEMKADQNYYNAAYAGNVDMMFSTWGGATYSGLGVLSNVYCDDHKGGGNQMEYGFDTGKVDVTISLDTGDKQAVYRASLKDWADWLNNRGVKVYTVDRTAELGTAAEKSIDLKTKVFAELERTYLEYYAAIPLYYRNTAIMRSEKIRSAANAYVDLVGYGGTRFMTFRYDDAAWEKLAKDKIDYTR